MKILLATLYRRTKLQRKNIKNFQKGQKIQKFNFL